jgi:hypothetical protein
MATGTYFTLAVIWIWIVISTQVKAIQLTIDDMDPSIRYEGPWSLGDNCQP